MFFHFEEVVGVGEAWICLKRTHVKNIRNLIMVKTLLLLKRPCVKRVAPHHHALAPKDRDVKLKKWNIFRLLGKLFGKQWVG